MVRFNVGSSTRQHNTIKLIEQSLEIVVALLSGNNQGGTICEGRQGIRISFGGNVTHYAAAGHLENACRHTHNRFSRSGGHLDGLDV